MGLIRRETSRQFRNKKRDYLKDKIDEIAMNFKNKNIRDLYRGINEFKRGYQHGINFYGMHPVVYQYHTLSFIFRQTQHYVNELSHVTCTIEFIGKICTISLHVSAH
jgi:hypothetical protein